MAINRVRLQHQAEEGSKAAARILSLLDRPDRLIGLILIGNNFVNILASAIAKLADEIQKGSKHLADYKVSFKNTGYVVESRYVVDNKLPTDIKADNHTNKVVYEIVKNDKDS